MSASANKRKESIRQRLIAERETFRQYTAGLDAADWQTPVYASEGGEWTAADLLRHIADSEPGMLGTMMRIRDGGEGVPADFDLTRWNAGRVRRAQNKTPSELLAGMESSREALLAFLDDLNADDLDKIGRHASLRLMSIEEILYQIADHEAHHLRELQAALAG